MASGVTEEVVWASKQGPGEWTQMVRTTVAQSSKGQKHVMESGNGGA